jgi:hypothetical protein
MYRPLFVELAPEDLKSKQRDGRFWVRLETDRARSARLSKAFKYFYGGHLERQAFRRRAA